MKCICCGKEIEKGNLCKDCKDFKPSLNNDVIKNKYGITDNEGEN